MYYSFDQHFKKHIRGKKGNMQSPSKEMCKLFNSTFQQGMWSILFSRLGHTMMVKVKHFSKEFFKSCSFGASYLPSYWLTCKKVICSSCQTLFVLRLFLVKKGVKLYFFLHLRVICYCHKLKNLTKNTKYWWFRFSKLIRNIFKLHSCDSLHHFAR